MEQNGLKKHLSPAAVWAFSIGTSIGWGSLVVTANTYLAQAGPAGTILGLLVGALLMLVISRNFAYLMGRYPEAGGAYAYCRETFGYDTAFLAAWFLAMTYFAVLWANLTSLPLYSRIFLGGVFRLGKLYTIFGYEVYLGEALLSMAALVLVGFLLVKFQNTGVLMMIVMAVIFCVGIIFTFVVGFFGSGFHFEPAFVPDSRAISQIINIAVISPWAFIGFENISHLTEEFDFEKKTILRVLLVSVFMTVLLYIFVTLLSVTAYPAQYDNWLSYIKDLNNLSGIEALPAFYAAYHYLGNFGVAILMLSLLSLVITSLIGNMTALSRLFYALSRDRVIPARFSHVNSENAPDKAIWLVVAISFFIPLLGRTAIGWIVDVTTIGATLIYGFVSAAALKMAKELDNKTERITGSIGLWGMIAFGVYVMLPNLVTKGSFAPETFFLFIIWTVLGFFFFRAILQADKERRFGSSIAVWIALLALVLLISLIWMRQSMINTNEKMASSIRQYYEETQESGSEKLDDQEFVQEQMAVQRSEDTRTMVMAICMFSFAIVIMLTNHSYMNRRAKEHEMLANIDPMTGVKSKHAYLNSEKEFNESIAEGKAREFAVVVCDVNGLKKINDTLGHKAGDEYIREACQMICKIFMHSPVYRVGGDEFVAILSGSDYVIRKELMLTLHDRSVDHINSGGAVVSGGCSDFRRGEDMNFHDVFERADGLMYKEKQLLKGLGAVTRSDAEEEAPAPQPAEEEQKIINIRRNILIVEDEMINQIMLGKALEDQYDVIYASDGMEALESMKIYKDKLALVLLDLQMPNMSGMEVLQHMRNDKNIKSIPVIVLTADQNAEVECLKMGAMDFIPKPYPAWEIIHARVDKCIELSENRDLINQTERDHLTKLFNYDYFLRYVNLFDEHYHDREMDAMVMDLNHFHLLNERYGKPYGDSVLERIGESLRHIAREVGGVGCRRTKDTFLLYCPHREDYEQILTKAVSGLDEDEVNGNRVRLRLGVYSKVDKTLDIERRFDYAKVAADSVRNSYLQAVGVYDSEMHEKELYRARLVEDFHTSIENEDFEVYFQPKYDIRPEVPVLASAEALVRWNHPELGLISPGVFIPLLENNGLILELDEYVWRHTAAQIHQWKERFGFSIPVSVNVSRIDMLTPNLKDIFTDILDTYGLTTADLVLEITESAYTGEADQVISVARELRGMNAGFRIEMDDFGTGYSSLGMLTHLPIDALKLDMSFVRSAFGEIRDFKMIELILDIAKYLNVPVVAEGVETEEQYRVLKEMGCDLIQGYYFSKPVPPEQFDRFMSEASIARKKAEK